MAQQITLAQLAEELRRKASEWSSYPWSRPLKKIRLSAIAATKQNFQRSQSPLGVAWLPVKHHRPRSGGTKPLYRYGQLMSSVTGAGPGHIDRLTERSLEIGTNLPHANIHQHGGTVSATKVKWLCIPITAKAFTAGSPRRFPGELRFQPTKRADTALMIEDRVGKGGRKLKSIVHYVLKKNVTIPARPFIGWNDTMMDKAELILADDVEKWLVR